jgi:hypothetical protein
MSDSSSALTFLQPVANGSKVGVVLGPYLGPFPECSGSSCSPESPPPIPLPVSRHSAYSMPRMDMRVCVRIRRCG